MNLLTNGFVNNCGRRFGSSEQFEADIVEFWLNGFCVRMDVRVDTLAADSGRITVNPGVILSWRYQGLALTYKIDLCLRQVAV